MTRRTDGELRGLRDVLSERLAGNQAPEPAMAEAFAGVLEASRRTQGPPYSDSDIIAGIALYSGQVVQAEDNGYNHFIALLPGYLGALRHENVHYVTTTSALAQHNHRDVGGLCAALGLRTVLLSGNQVSREAPDPVVACDIAYASYQKIAVEYLGEHLAPGGPAGAFGKQQIAIVDQADWILIDRANLPLIIRAPRPSDADYRHKIAAAAAGLERGKHYDIDQTTGMVRLDADGLAQGAALLRVGTLEGLAAAVQKKHLEDALRAKDWYRRGRDYQVANGRIAVSPGGGLDGALQVREGILQAVEAKEGLATSPEEVVWARITVSGYFRTYARLCGLSGVTARAALELESIYGLSTAVIPAGQPSRVDHSELSFDKAQSRFAALAEDIARKHRAGQPVVIGAQTPADSTLVNQLLAKRKIPHRTLLPDDEEAASGAMAQAGKAGSVTILIAAAARGYDIPVEQSAGLAVLVAGRSRSGRADQWLRGLAGRRGCPGESQFYLSFEDQLLRGLQSRLWSAVPERIRRRADATPLSSIQVRLIEEAQRAAEQADTQRRRDWLAVEEVENAQRIQVYSLIDALVEESDLTAFTGTVIDEVVAIYVRRYRDDDRLLSALAMLYPTQLTMNDLLAQTGNPAEKQKRISIDAHIAYGRHEQRLGSAAMRQAERKISSSLLTRSWSKHLAELAAMRAVAGLDDGSRDQLTEYHQEATKSFAMMLDKVKENIVGYLFHSEPDAR
jgi:preprotein translocase subunit SecA